jgi:ribosome biogenesis GTPase A
MSDYDLLKQNLLNTVSTLKPLIREEQRQSLADVGAKLQEEAFNLVILGQFKRGKSTFINALLGEDLLPTAIVPLTSVVTVIQYGPRVRVCVQFMDGKEKDVPVSDLSELITERGNPNNHKRVQEVTIYHPSPYLQGGVRIIDTPGVGSVYRHNTDVAYRYLPYVEQDRSGVRQGPRRIHGVHPLDFVLGPEPPGCDAASSFRSMRPGGKDR